jgi:Xaa-Pro dipeptidase
MMNRSMIHKPAVVPDLRPLHAEHVARLEREYARILGEAGWDGVLIHSGAPRLRSEFDDQYWPLRPTPHFQHWLPLAEADCGLLVVPGRRPTLYRNTALSFWEGRAAVESDHFWGAFDVVDVPDPDRVPDLLPSGLRLAFLGDDAARATRWRFEPDARNPDALWHRLDLVRSAKTEYERCCLAEANRRAAVGHRAVLQAFRAGAGSELELHLAFLRATGQDDPETPYKNIVAFGAHAATLHHVCYGRTPARRPSSLLIDAGATCNGYHSDITRTAVEGASAAADTFRALIDELEALQQEMCRRVRPGVAYQRLHNESHELLAGALRALGIARASAEELVESGATRKFLPHGLGHSLGLQTHDVGCALVRPEPRNPFLRNTADIAVGQVFTIEPGCYFIAPLLDELRAEPIAAAFDWRLVDELAKFGGVRIEDDIAVVDDGVRNLTREHLPE